MDFRPRRGASQSPDRSCRRQYCRCSCDHDRRRERAAASGAQSRALVTTTPRPLRLLERIGEMEWTVTTSGRTSDNINLDEKFVEIMTATYGGTKLGRQELDGELLFDMEGALWPRELLASSRWSGPQPRFDRVMVGVDPPAG